MVFLFIRFSTKKGIRRLKSLREIKIWLSIQKFVKYQKKSSKNQEAVKLCSEMYFLLKKFPYWKHKQMLKIKNRQLTTMRDSKIINKSRVMIKKLNNF